MAMFPDTMPEPEPDFVDRPFWEHCNARELRFQHCADCGIARHPPTPVCHRCLSVNAGWRQAPVAGKVYSYTVVRHASHEAVRQALPYVVAAIEFEGLPGVRLVSNVMTRDVDSVHIGMPVWLHWETTAAGQALPRFVPELADARNP